LAAHRRPASPQNVMYELAERYETLAQRLESEAG
jgi:hypothetical protein